MSTSGHEERPAVEPVLAGWRNNFPAPDGGGMAGMSPALARRQLQVSLGVLGLAAAVGVVIAALSGTHAPRPADRSAGAPVSRAAVQQPQFVRPVTADRAISPTGG